MNRGSFYTLNRIPILFHDSIPHLDFINKMCLLFAV